jgi:hypothetical protein
VASVDDVPKGEFRILFYVQEITEEEIGQVQIFELVNEMMMRPIKIFDLREFDLLYKFKDRKK